MSSSASTVAYHYLHCLTRRVPVPLSAGISETGRKDSEVSPAPHRPWLAVGRTRLPSHFSQHSLSE